MKKLGIDLDGCVDESPEFFRILTQMWPGDVIVITFREDKAKAIADLNKYQIRFTEVVLVKSLTSKWESIVEHDVGFYIDDQPEALKWVPSTVAVMLFRNEGNFDVAQRKWMFSEQTAKLV